MELDGRSDIYALGAILFEMLSGSMPYEADTPMQLAIKHIIEPVPRILERAPALPPECDTVIKQAMAKERDARYPTGQAFETLRAPGRDQRCPDRASGFLSTGDHEQRQVAGHLGGCDHGLLTQVGDLPDRAGHRGRGDRLLPQHVGDNSVS